MTTAKTKTKTKPAAKTTAMPPLRVIAEGVRVTARFISLKEATALGKRFKGNPDGLKAYLKANRARWAANTTPDKDTDKFLAQFLGTNAWMLDVPELARIMVIAAQDKWDTTRIQGKVGTTTWFRNANERQRDWVAANPADRQSLIAATAERMAEAKGQLFGRTFDAQPFIESGEAERVASGGMLFESWRRQQTTLAESDPDSVFSTDVEDSINDLRTLASAHMLHLGDDTLTDWARHIARRTRSVEDFRRHVAEQAAALYPMHAEDIRAGVAPTTLFGAYREEAQNLLGRPVTFNDPLLRDYLSERGDNTQQKSLDDFMRRVRGTEEFRQSARGREHGDELMTLLGRTFGVRL